LLADTFFAVDFFLATAPEDSPEVIETMIRAVKALLREDRRILLSKLKKYNLTCRPRHSRPTFLDEIVLVLHSKDRNDLRQAVV
jgi:hypothetical protein